ncbi:MAG TPA: family 78 glycoside hydrolase catalytic domain [Verrucomicrobiae bacterium]|nr:family 78 glycoside hydrolase catalytic domain [Verrucomicrobiae bacterium]
MNPKFSALIAFLSFTFWSSAQPASGTASSPYSIVERGPHHRLWQRVTWVTNAFDGSARARTNSYVEMATGLEHTVNGQWVDSSDQIQLTSTGAEATNSQHQVQFRGNINSAGAITTLTADGKGLSSSVLGLAYADLSSGKSILISEIKDSTGQLLPSGNQVLYTNVCTDILADLLYQNSVASLEQILVIRSQLPDPAQWGLNSAMCVLQLITDFGTNAPAPQITETAVGAEIDDFLDFGAMKMPQGAAFALGSEDNRIPVTKRWLISTNDGRNVLVEQVPFVAVQPQLQGLPPPPGTASLEGSPDPLLHRVLARLPLPAPRPAGKQTPSLQLARNPPSAKGFALDYILLTTQTNQFQSDLTYYIPGGYTIHLSGSNVFEGGTVIKYGTNASISASLSTSTSINFFGDMYRPIAMTASDDNSCGQTIAGSTGTPTNYYANPALYLSSSGVVSPTLANFRISFAQQAIHADATSLTLFLSDGQIVNCSAGVYSEGQGSAFFRNMLFAKFSTALNLSYMNASAQNVTFDGLPPQPPSYTPCFLLLPAGGPTNTMTLNLVNCILDDISSFSTANPNAISGDHNGFYNNNGQAAFGSSPLSTTINPFQTVGAGNYYLATGGNFRNAGSTNIDSSLLTDLSKRTTYPPIVYAQTIISNLLTLFPQAQRNDSIPDLGYSYAPLDYALGFVAAMSPITISVTPGAVIATFGTNTGTYGIGILNGARLLCKGAPNNLSRIVCYNTVQEESTSAWEEPSAGMITDNFGAGAAGGLNCRFTDFSSLAQDVSHLNMATVIANLQDSQLHGGALTAFPSTINLTNCLLERVHSWLWQEDNAQPVVRNNLFFGGTFDFLPMVATNAIVQDNCFDQTVIPEDLTASGYLGGHNASVTNYDHMKPAFPSDLVLSNSPAYQAGPLGNFYQLSTGRLFNADTNTTADQVGLYHYTTITNLVNNLEIKETNSFLDCGYHYVAADASGIPIDSDGGVVPDYLENTAGDGHTNNVGEINWQDPSGDFNYLLLPQYLRCEYRVDPWGVTTNYGPPRLYWIVTSTQRADRQVAYQIQVATSTNNLNAGYGDMWDSSKVFSAQTTHVEYNGLPLASGQRLWWHVRTWDLYTGLASPWSTNAFFQMGLLSTNDWQAQWLTTSTDPGDNVSPIYRHAFVQLTNNIKRATAYVSAKGVYELWIDGQRIGQHILAPEWTDYNQRFQYQTYDVTPYLLSTNTDGTNHAIGAIVGEGWFHGSISHDAAGYYYYTNYNTSHGPKQILVQLQIDQNDGSSNVVASTGNWACDTNGPVEYASIEQGETSDTTRLASVSNWSTFQYAGQADVFTAPVATEPLIVTQLVAQPADPIQSIDYVEPIDMWTNRNGGATGNRFVRIYDMGRVIEGWCVLSLVNTNEPTGTNIYLRHAESLQLDSNNQQVRGANISIYSLCGTWGSTRMAAQKETYVILHTNSVQQFQPHFTYHGFRFVEVDAPEDIALSTNALVGWVIRTGMATTGAFSCSQPDVNQLMTNAYHTLENNVYGLPTACADRNERYGWFCDTDVAAQSSAFLLDMASLWTKSIRDIRDDQFGGASFGGFFYHGYYSIINPSVGGGGVGDIGISSGGVIRPWRLYENYADVRMLNEDYLSVSNWLNFLGVNWPNNHLTPWESAGDADVCNMGQFSYVPSGWPAANAQMSAGVQGLWAYVCSADLAANMSQVLQDVALASGNTAVATVLGSNYTAYTNTAANIRTYFTNAANGLVTYDAQTGTNIVSVGNGTQGDYANALYFNMVPTSQRSNCLYLLLNAANKGILNYNHNYSPPSPLPPCTNHLSTGAFATTRAILELTANGFNSEAYSLLLDYPFPSWLYNVTNGGAIYSSTLSGTYGASTCWEHWNGWVSGTGGGYASLGPGTYNSFNELWNTSVGEWIWRVVAGINPDDNNPGFQNVIIYPQPGGSITNCSAAFNSIHGAIVSAWTNAPTTYTLSVTVPANSTASIFVVGSTNLANITESGTGSSNFVGLLSSPVITNGVALFEVGSGSYDFKVSF